MQFHQGSLEGFHRWGRGRRGVGLCPIDWLQLLPQPAGDAGDEWISRSPDQGRQFFWRGVGGASPPSLQPQQLGIEPFRESLKPLVAVEAEAASKFQQEQVKPNPTLQQVVELLFKSFEVGITGAVKPQRVPAQRSGGQRLDLGQNTPFTVNF